MCKRSVYLAVLPLFLGTSCQWGEKPGGLSSDTFPPEAVDHLEMTITLEVEIAGIGKDKVQLEGTVVVHRSGPRGADGKTMVGNMVGASFRGTSDVFGPVVASQSPILQSPCQYTYEGPGQYNGYIDINGWFWLPDHNLMTYSDGPVRVEGTASRIPPVGQKAKITAEQVSLHDLSKAKGNPIGFLSRASGEIKAVVFLPR